MADLIRRELARHLLLAPFEPYRGYTSSVSELPTPENVKPWALHMLYTVKKDEDELQTPFLMSFVEIDHYHTEDQLRRNIATNRDNIEQRQRERIDAWEYRHTN